MLRFRSSRVFLNDRAIVRAWSLASTLAVSALVSTVARADSPPLPAPAPAAATAPAPGEVVPGAPAPVSAPVSIAPPAPSPPPFGGGADPAPRAGDDSGAESMGQFVESLAAAEHRSRLANGIGLLGASAVSIGTGAAILSDDNHTNDRTYGAVLMGVGGVSLISGVLLFTSTSASERLAEQYKLSLASGTNRALLVRETEATLDSLAASYRSGRITNGIFSAIIAGLGVALFIDNETSNEPNKDFNRIVFGGVVLSTLAGGMTNLLPTSAEAMIAARRARTGETATNHFTIKPRVGPGSLGLVGTF